jgi:hypothetical protein
MTGGEAGGHLAGRQSDEAHILVRIDAALTEPLAEEYHVHREARDGGKCQGGAPPAAAHFRLEISVISQTPAVKDAGKRDRVALRIKEKGGAQGTVGTMIHG